MRSVPRSRHVVAVLVCVGLAGLYGGLATMDTSLSQEQVLLATGALKAADPGILTPDPLFAPGPTACYPNPAFVGGVRLLMDVTGGDPLWAMRVLVGPLTLLYLLTMYALLLHQCRSWSIALFVAALSTVVIDAIGGSAWGLGTLSSAGPAGLPQALTPLIVLGLLDALQQPKGRAGRLVVVFLLTGLLGSFDLCWTVNLAIVLAVAYLAARRFAPIAWAVTLGCLLLAGAGALPSLIQHFQIQLAGTGGATGTQALSETLREGEQALLYPQALRALPDWMIWVLPVAIPTIVVLSQVERFHVPWLGFWIAWTVAVIAVAVVLAGGSQLAGLALGSPAPVTGFVRAWALLMLPLYVLFAQALTSLFRLTRARPGLLRVICAVAAAAWLIPSPNLSPARHAAYSAASVLLSEEAKPRRLRKLQESATRREEMAAIARWAARNTPPEAVFLTDQSVFRLLARRAIVAGDHDGGYILCSRPGQLAQWRQRLTRQGQLIHPAAGPADPAAISQFVGELAGQPPLATGSAWYVVLPARVGPEGSTILSEELHPEWGRSYRLYRLR